MEPALVVFLALFGPALLLGAAFTVVIRRHPGADPASARPAVAIAHQIEGRTSWRRLGRRLDPKTQTGLLLTVGLLVLIVTGAVLGVLALLVRSDSSLLHFDKSVAPWGEAHMTDVTRHVVDAVTDLGSTGYIVGLTIGVFIFEMIRRPSRWLPVFLVAVAVGQTLMSTEIKNLIDRVRPTANPIAHTLGPSFPSGHTTGAAACFAAFALVLGRGRSRSVQSMLAGLAVFVAVAVASSRVILGVHWLSDVVGGLALGWGWFALCSIAFGGRLLRLGAPVEAAERIGDMGLSSTTMAPDAAPGAVHRADRRTGALKRRSSSPRRL
jgi:undecaprenyl-diphosphatase